MTINLVYTVYNIFKEVSPIDHNKQKARGELFFFHLTYKNYDRLVIKKIFFLNTSYTFTSQTGTV